MSDKNRTTVLSTPTKARSLASPGSSGANATGGAKQRCEDIISCISALDEMLAEFDDTSLPYTSELDASCATNDTSSLQPTTKTTEEVIGVSSDGVVVSASKVQTNQKQFLPPAANSHPLQTKITHNNVVLSNDNARAGIISSTSASFVNGNQQVDQNLNWNQNQNQVPSSTTSNPVILTSHSHLIQIPVAESSSTTTTSKSSSAQQQKQSKNNSKGTYRASSSSSSREMNGNSCNSSYEHWPSPAADRKGKVSNGGGTYSKGTSYEILIPKITSGSISRDSSISSGKGTITTSSHSSRASIMVPVIESPQDSSSKNGNVGKVRSQLNTGIFQPSNVTTANSTSIYQQQHLHHQPHGVVMQNDGVYSTKVPVQGSVASSGSEAIYENQLVNNEQSYQCDTGKNNDHHNHGESKHCSKIMSNSATYIAVSEGKSSLGQSSSSGVSSAMATMKGDEEQWNFPSEKNLPRSLRKTRKTCFLEDGSGDCEGKNAKALRVGSPFCCASSNSSEPHTICVNEHCYSGDSSSGYSYANECQKSPRVMPRKGAIPQKCEMIDKGDGNFVLSSSQEGKQAWSNNHHHQIASASSGNKKDKVSEKGSRRKIYEDVVLAQATAYVQNHGDAAAMICASPSSTFTSSSGVSLSVTSNPTLGEEEESQLPLHQKSRKGQQLQQQIPKPRVRQQVPSPGTEIPSPANNIGSIPPNQFIPFVIPSRPQQHQSVVLKTQVSCAPIMAMPVPSRHSPDSVEIATEEEEISRSEEQSHKEHCQQNMEEMMMEDQLGEEDEILNTSSSASPVKLGLRKSSLDTEFEETVSDSKILKIEGKSRRESSSKGHSKNRFVDGIAQNGSLPNQSQMMRMMMMMKSKNSSVSSSRSSSSSGSVSVNSSSSDNNCGDVFHENIVQDYPTNIFNVATATASSASSLKKTSCESSPAKSAIPTTGSQSQDILQTDTKSDAGAVVVVAPAAPVVVLRRTAANARGNLQQLSPGKKNGATPGQQNSTIEIDDGYLSMINRNEAPLLWPEEFIQNETFSKDELKRLSVHLPEDEDDDMDVEDDEGSSNSHSSHQKSKGASENNVVVLVPNNKSGFLPKKNNKTNLSSESNTSSSNHHNNEQHQSRRMRRGRERNNDVIASTSIAGRSSTEKTDYFSDDSLEMEGDELLLQSTTEQGGSGGGKIGNNSSDNGVVVRASTSFVIPFHSTKEELEEQHTSECQSSVRKNQIRKSNSQVSRIPKMVSPSSSSSSSQIRRGSSGSIQKRDSFSTSNKASSRSEYASPVRKPCSFFIPFSDSTTASKSNKGIDRKLSMGETAAIHTLSVHVAQTRSSSLPSSRRNSSSDTGKSQNGIAWNISCAPQGDMDKQGQGLETKASYDSDFNKGTVNCNAGIVAPPNKDAANSATTTTTTTTILPSNNNNNATSSGGKVEIITERKDRTLEKVKKTVNKENDGGDRSKEINNKDCAPTFASNITITHGISESNPASQNVVTATTTTNAGGDDLGGNRRRQFEKQQTFIVTTTPCRDITISAGQRLNDSGGGKDDSNASESERKHAENINAKVSTATIDRTRTHNQCDGDKDSEKKGEKREAMIINNDIDIDLKPKTDYDNERQQQHHEDIDKMINELDKLDLSSCVVGAGEGDKELPTSTTTAITSEPKVGMIITMPQESQGRETATNSHSDSKIGDDHDHDRDHTHDKYETQDSVNEELDTVVKMFLKATKSLLDPEAHGCEESVRTNSYTTLETSIVDDQQRQDGNVPEDSSINSPSFSNMNMTEKQPLMTSTPIVNRSPSGSKQDNEKLKSHTTTTTNGDTTSTKRLSFLLVSEDDADAEEEEELIEDLHEQPPAFIPEPPPLGEVNPNPIQIMGPSPLLQQSVKVVDTNPNPAHQHHHHSLDGKATLDLLSQRITRNCPSPVENMSVSQFLHNKKNIWAMYDRPYDEDVLPPSFPRGFASRSQENLIDAMTHERLTKSFSARGQSSTLPLNCRPPPVQRRTSTFRNMFNKFRKHKATSTNTSVIPEGLEIRDEEAQSITSRETGPSEGKKRGFFSRLFRRSRKN